MNAMTEIRLFDFMLIFGINSALVFGIGYCWGRIHERKVRVNKWKDQ